MRQQIIEESRETIANALNAFGRSTLYPLITTGMGGSIGFVAALIVG